MKKFFYHAFLGILMLILVALALMQTAPMKRKSVDLLMEKLYENTGYKITYSLVEGFPPFFFYFTDLKISKGAQNLFKAETCSLSWAPWHLLTGSFVVSHLDLEKPWINPAWNIEASPPSPPANNTSSWHPTYFALHDFCIRRLILSGEESPFNLMGSAYFNSFQKTFFVEAHALPSSDLPFPSLAKLTLEGSEDKLDAQLHIAEKKGGALAAKLQLEDSFELESHLILSPAINGKNEGVYSGTFMTNFVYREEKIDLQGTLKSTLDGRWEFEKIKLALPSDIALLGQGRYQPEDHSVDLLLRLSPTSLTLTEDLKFDLGGTLVAHGTPETLDINLLFNQINSPFMQIDSSHFKLTLKDLMGNALKGKIESEGIPFHMMKDTITFSGKLRLDMSLDGTWKAPLLNGTTLLEEGAYENLETGAIFTSIRGRLQPSLDKIVMQELIASDNKEGSVTASGEIFLDPAKKFPFHFDFNVNKALLIRQDYAKVSASGTLHYDGNSDEAKAVGVLHLDSALITIPEEKSAHFSHVDVTFIDKEGKPLAKTSALAIDEWPIYLDVQLLIPRNAKVDGPHLESEWKGDLKFSGTTDNPLVYGTMELISGEYDFRGRPFTSKQGKIIFAGDPVKKSTLYISAKQHIEEIDVEVILKGPISEPEIVLHSTPPLSKQEILSWILFNRGISSINSYEGEELQRTEITVSGGVGDDLFSKVRQSIGIDRVDINTSGRGANSLYGENEVSLRIGKYISRGVFVSINKSINAEANQIEIEANLAKYWKIEGEVGDNAEGKFIIKWERDY